MPEPRSTLALPLPTPGRNCSVFTALEQRQTIRAIAATPLPRQMLANLLWAAFGINRLAGPFNGVGRTAASASNSQEIDLYVALQDGIYLYDAFNNHLAPVVVGDHRASAMNAGQRTFSDLANASRRSACIDDQRVNHGVFLWAIVVGI